MPLIPRRRSEHCSLGIGTPRQGWTGMMDQTRKSAKPQKISYNLYSLVLWVIGNDDNDNGGNDDQMHHHGQDYFMSSLVHSSTVS